MPKALKYGLFGLLGLVTLFVVIGFFLPSAYHVERSITIAAPPQKVFDLVNDLPSNKQWSPWAEMDDSMVWTMGDKTAGTGASYSWTSEEMGNGSLKIRESVAPSKVVNDLDFGQGGLATGTWTFEAEGEGTKATWALDGDSGMNPIGRWFGVMMDGMVGADFERGLANLKKTAEAG